MICDCPKVDRTPCERPQDSAPDHCGYCGHGLACHVKKVLMAQAEELMVQQRSARARASPIEFVRKGPRASQPQPRLDTYDNPTSAAA